MGDCRFIRIQYSHCESKSWSRLLGNLDNDFLMNLALGNICVIHDYSNKGGMPRSLWQGVPFIIYCLQRLWFNRELNVFVREMKVTNYFMECYRAIPDYLRKRIKYFKKFLFTETLNIKCRYGATNLDGRYGVYKDLVKEWMYENYFS